MTDQNNNLENNAGALLKTPLHALHGVLGATMAPFAGYELPVNFDAGVLKEHLHTREHAGLFDVSHMGQAVLRGADHETTAAALEMVTPGDLIALKPGAMRYTLLLNEQGGVLDDLIVTRDFEDGVLKLVVNAACKYSDYDYLNSRLPLNIALEPLEDLALLAMQGPAAAEVLAKYAPDASKLKFMTSADAEIEGVNVRISRCGYTGEDGFEISLPASKAERLAQLLLSDGRVAPIGLGARDSLRLEAGLCLYGNELTPSISPVEAGLEFAIGKRRRLGRDFAGAERILRELEEGAARRLVGIRPQGRAPARAGVAIQNQDGEKIGEVTSGGFGPSVNGPISIGYVAASHSDIGVKVNLIIRGKSVVGEIVNLPFAPHRYYRG